MVKVGDFGVSKKLEPDQSKAETFVGAKAYLAPECFCGTGYGTAADIWSLGCVLYEIITFECPVS